MAQVCDEIIAHGVCNRVDCPFSHELLSCETCKQLFDTAVKFEQHLGFRYHKKKALQAERRRAGIAQPVFCTVCSVDLATEMIYYSSHVPGKRHRKNMKEQGILDEPGPEEQDVPRNCTRCDTCSTNIPTRDWDKHVRTPRHAGATRFNALQGALEESERDKNGLIVSPEELDFGFVAESASRNAVWFMTLVIHNTNATDLHLVETRLSSQMTSRANSDFEIEGQARDRVLKSGQELSLRVRFKPEGNRGRYQERVEILFRDPGLNKRFGITRTVVATIGVKEDYEQLKATRPYVRPKRSTQLEEPVAEITPGIAPPAIDGVPWAVKLAPHDPPKALVKMLEEAYLDNIPPSKLASRIRAAFLPSGLSVNTYARQFSYLMWVEEDRARRDLGLYDLEEATLEPFRNTYYKLKVEGLAEKRPSIIVSDRILVKNYGSSVNHWFEGHVHEVRESEVVLRFHGKFNSFRGQRYHVRFVLNRLVYRRMHQGLNTAFTENRVLFPDAKDIRNIRRPSSADMDILKLTDRKIMANPPQLEAVAAILNRPPGSVPFIVFGPPGTGKTVTIVEAIRQLVQGSRTIRILACAPSNSAADLIAQRLAGLGKAQVFRLNAYSRSVEPVPSSVLELSLTTKESSDYKRFAVPPVEELKKFRVIICTCLSASIPYGLGIPAGHFTHVFLDEAGQATEPEVMISIKTTAGPRTNVVLSGDSKQLGPIVRSPVARDLGLSQSYLDRLMANPIYDEETGKGVTITKLIKNWRSHPAIIRFPNGQFYRGDLVASGDPVMTHSLCDWSGLVKKNFPVIFHGIAGKDEREASSPSFFNIAEASEVNRYIKLLREDKKLRLKSEHIGVISPYHAQVQKIRKLLKDKEIKVGSVEEYQGQEKRVIIVSTVRSSMEGIKFDLRHTLGFVANPRRFNVAVTRAQALLIVIGDPVVLSLDPLWRAFLSYISVNGGCTGRPIDWDPTEEVDINERYDIRRRSEAINAMNDLITRTKEEILAHTEVLGDHEADTLEGNADQPWREDE